MRLGRAVLAQLRDVLAAVAADPRGLGLGHTERVHGLDDGGMKFGAAVLKRPLSALVSLGHLLKVKGVVGALMRVGHAGILSEQSSRNNLATFVLLV